MNAMVLRNHKTDHDGTQTWVRKHIHGSSCFIDALSQETFNPTIL